MSLRSAREEPGFRAQHEIHNGAHLPLVRATKPRCVIHALEGFQYDFLLFSYIAKSL